MPEFPHPLRVETPAGCEGWEEMYPYWALFDERRRESDENRLWFWNSQHFPFPMPAFDMVEVDHPYYTLGGWQNRAFAVPPGDGRGLPRGQRLRLHLAEPGHRPGQDRRARRSTSRSAPATTSRTGTSCTRAGARRWRRSTARSRRSHVPDLPEYEPDEVVFGEQNLSNIDLLRAYSHTLRCAEMMWQYHFEFLLLGYGAYLTFAEFLRARAAGHPRPAHLADGGRRRRGAVPRRHRAAAARAAGDRHGRGRRVRRGPHARTRSTRRSARATRAAAGSRSSRRSRTPGSTWGPATGSTTTTAAGTTTRRSRTRRSWATWRRCKDGKDIERPTEELAKERDRLAEEYGALLDEEARPALPGAARALAHGLPVRGGAQVLLRLLVPVALLQQGARVRRAAREARLPRGGRGHLPALAPRGDGGARGAVAHVVHRRPGARPAPLAADRGAPQGAARAARRVDAAAGARRGCPRR